jgi:hypothetical protein
MEELVVLLQGAIETANVERWALEHGENPPPAGLKGLLRTTAYEVTVVDAFHRLSRRHLERHGYVGVWERPLLTGRRGRPKSIDVSLFHDATKKETRLELGLYTKMKLREDAKKLHDERENPGVPGYTIELNLLALWELRPLKTTSQVIDDWMKQFVTDAAAVSTTRFTVEPILASTVDLFAAETGGHRYAVVGLFLVTSDVGDGGDA